MIMDKYFWKNDEVYIYSEVQIEQGYADGLKELTKQELEQHLNPSVSTEQLAEQIRTERDDLIKNVRWRVERHQDEIALGLKLTEPLEPILEYIQKLRDIPQSKDFPNKVKFPKEPKCGQKLKS